jgi:hypothetical protein
LRNTHEVLGGKSEGKKPYGRLRHSWEGNVETDLKELGYKAD